ncbi:unnamed protein product, partial [Effrenium voratum]
ESQRPSGTLAAYVTPLEKHWCDVESGFNFFQALSSAEAASLALVDIKCDFKMVKGGHAPVGNKKKTSVTRASWRKCDIEENLSENARRAFHWLRANNTTYKRYVDQHRSLLRDRASQEQWHIIPTAQLLLGMPGIEVAARPWLYPTAAFSDTDLRPRLLGLGRITNKQKPSLKTSFTRKLTSRCQSYQADFPLFALLHDIALARQVSGMVKAAEEKGIAPDEAASGAQNFGAFWADVCRQRGMPNLFFTIAPAEWKFPLHEGMFGHCGAPAELEKVQATLALHMRHVLKEVVEQCVLNRSPLLLYLERLFNARVDVQCQRGEHCLLRYVSGYVSKSSDALEFKRKEWSAAQGVPLTHWRQTYRLLCKQAPLEPEMALHLAGAPLMESSYRGATVYAPLPWNSAKRSSLANNQARVQYLGYLAWSKTIVSEAKFGRKLPFIEWLRLYSAALDESGGYTFKERGVHGAGSSKEACAVGVVFSFELLDIFVGQFCATFIPHTSEDEFAMPESEESKTPEGARFLAMALKHPGIRKLAAEAGKRRQGLASISGHDISDELTLDYLLNLMVTDLRLRGLESHRIRTFSARIQATALLLRATAAGEVNAASWNARRVSSRPQRRWSAQQAQALEAIAAGLASCDANASPNARLLLLTGGPGTGKTEVVAQAALDAAQDNCKVLIACPTGVLVAAYRERLQGVEGVTIETVHASFKITRDADAVYVPPGRLRHFDLIVFDETSQLDGLSRHLSADLEAGKGLPGDAAAEGGRMIFEVGMRVRLTRNLDKDRGFVNGALGTIEIVLRKDVFLMRLAGGSLLLVHPMHDKGGPFMPCVYGYALTIRRAQGSTLDCAILRFDKKRPDRGYAYVAASRVRSADRLILMGPVRRTDWLPVGKDDGSQQIFPSSLSDSEVESSNNDSDISESGFYSDSNSEASFVTHNADFASLPLSPPSERGGLELEG